MREVCAGLSLALGVWAGPAAGATAPADPPSVPLAARSGPRGPTLFTTLPSALTGLKAPNPYDDPAMWGRLYHEFNSGAIGTGGIGRASLSFAALEPVIKRAFARKAMGLGVLPAAG